MNSKGRIDRNASLQDTTDSQYPSVNLSAGQHLHGFEVKAVTPIDELRAVAIELLHPRSGARLLHLYTDDTRNWFSISPITPTFDDTRLQPVRPEVSHQPKWKSPQTLTDTYPIGADEPLTEKTYLMLSWIIGGTTDPENVILCSILNLILFGNEGAPLRKAIVDSKLGTDILIDFQRDFTGPNRTFCVGLVGSEADRVDAFTELVINTLTQIADAEIDREKIEAAFQRITYDYQEVTPNFPFQMMKRVVNTWIYEKDPTLFLKMGTHLSTIRKRWEQNPQIFLEVLEGSRDKASVCVIASREKLETENQKMDRPLCIETL